MGLQRQTEFASGGKDLVNSRDPVPYLGGTAGAVAFLFGNCASCNQFRNFLGDPDRVPHPQAVLCRLEKTKVGKEGTAKLRWEWCHDYQQALAFVLQEKGIDVALATTIRTGDFHQ
ncbi:hypothetical protein STLA111740_09980 [Stenotrophomonas lactitubi]